MKYKVVKGSALFEKLIAFKEKCAAVNKQADDLVETIPGAIKRGTMRSIAGGIDAIQFKEKPDGWRSVGEKYDNLYYPKSSDKSNKELLDKIQALPRVQVDELSGIVDFKAQWIGKNGGLCQVVTVGVVWGDDVLLIKVDEACEYTPVEGMEEIMATEYKKLYKELTGETLSNSQ